MSVPRDHDGEHGRPERSCAGRHARDGRRWGFARAFACKRHHVGRRTRIVEGRRPLRGPTAVGLKLIDTAHVLEAGTSRRRSRSPRSRRSARRSPPARPDGWSTPPAAGHLSCPPLEQTSICGPGRYPVDAATAQRDRVRRFGRGAGNDERSRRGPAMVGFMTTAIVQLCAAPGL